jgi:hypothetical protein
VISSISISITITVAAAVLLIAAIVLLTTRRLRAHNRLFELGSVSQQWLLGHRGDER